METIEVKPRSVRGALIPLTAMRRDVYLPPGKYTVNRGTVVYDPRVGDYCPVDVLADPSTSAVWVVPVEAAP